MYFLNLSFLQFLAVFGAVSALSVALYLLDRSRRKLVVSTLRFWIAAEQPAVAARRRRVQQPWSLLLQLASMALLLLAIGQLRLGTPALTTRGMGAGEMKIIARLIVRVLDAPDDAAVHEKVKGEVKELCAHFPLYAKRIADAR